MASFWYRDESFLCNIAVSQWRQILKRHPHGKLQQRAVLYLQMSAREMRGPFVRKFSLNERGRRCWMRERNGYTDQWPPLWLRVLGGPRAQGRDRRGPHLLHNRTSKRTRRPVYNPENGPCRNYGVFARHVGPPNWGACARGNVRVLNPELSGMSERDEKRDRVTKRVWNYLMKCEIRWPR